MQHQFKLGKGPARQDDRNIQFSAILKSAAIPAAYNIDSAFTPQPALQMFGNDVLGDCVIACRANATLRFEFKETKAYPNITLKEVQKEYFAETGGPDSGLVILDSLKLWRSRGWTAGGRKLKIASFTQINPKSQSEVSSAIYADLGIEIGVSLPLSAQDQIDAGKLWAVTSGPRARAGSWGGHCVLVTAYDATGLTCVTWARKQRMTWDWFFKYCDEAYATFDANDTAKRARVVDLSNLTSLVESR